MTASPLTFMRRHLSDGLESRGVLTDRLLRYTETALQLPPMSLSNDENGLKAVVRYLNQAAPHFWEYRLPTGHFPPRLPA